MSESDEDQGDLSPVSSTSSLSPGNRDGAYDSDNAFKDESGQVPNSSRSSDSQHEVPSPRAARSQDGNEAQDEKRYDARTDEQAAQEPYFEISKVTEDRNLEDERQDSMESDYEPNTPSSVGHGSLSSSESDVPTTPRSIQTPQALPQRHASVISRSRAENLVRTVSLCEQLPCPMIYS